MIHQLNSDSLDFLKDFASRYYGVSKDRIHLEFRQTTMDTIDVAQKTRLRYYFSINSLSTTVPKVDCVFYLSSKRVLFHRYGGEITIGYMDSSPMGVFSDSYSMDKTGYSICTSYLEFTVF